MRRTSREPAEPDAGKLGDPLVAAERRHLPEHAVAVRPRLADEVLREPARLPERVLAGRRVELPRRLRVGDGCAVAERPDVRRVDDTEGLVDHDAAAVVERELQRRERRAAPHAGGPDERPRRDRASRPRAPPRARRTTRASSRRGSRSRVARARGACTPRACAGSPGGSAERRRRAPSAATSPQRRVRPANRVLSEVVQLRERLDAGVARADEDEAEVARRLVRVEARRGGLERAQEPVAQRDRVGDVLEPAPVLGEARGPGTCAARRRARRRAARTRSRTCRRASRRRPTSARGVA